MENYFSLAGKVALVTGAAKGLGAAIADGLAAHGAAVVVTDVDEKLGQTVARGIENDGGKATFLKLDVLDETGWETVVEKTIEQFGGLDILVNNAGIEKLQLLADTDLESHRRVMAVNVDGVFLGIRTAVRVMSPGGRSGRGGSIINMSSASGHIGFPGLSSYSASKGAVRLLTKNAAVEFARLKLNVRVNSIHPAFIMTDMGINVTHEMVKLGMAQSTEEAVKAINEVLPMGRCGEPRDVAAAAIYLASDAAQWVTGAEINVDGGLVAG